MNWNVLRLGGCQLGVSPYCAKPLFAESLRISFKFLSFGRRFEYPEIVDNYEMRISRGTMMRQLDSEEKCRVEGLSGGLQL